MKNLANKQLELESASKRMQELLLELQLDEKGLGNSIGKKTGDIIRNVITMRNGISSGLASSICRAHPQISYKWLFAGQGEMINSNLVNKPHENKTPDQPVADPSIDKYLKIISERDETINNLNKILLEYLRDSKK